MKAINSIMEEKIRFIDDNSHIINNLLDTKLGRERTVLEVVTEFIASDDVIDNCLLIDELRELISVSGQFFDKKMDSSDSYGVIFSVASYVNSSVMDINRKNKIRNRLRLYTSRFENGNSFSINNNKYVTLEVNKTMVKK